VEVFVFLVVQEIIKPSAKNFYWHIVGSYVSENPKVEYLEVIEIIMFFFWKDKASFQSKLGLYIIMYFEEEYFEV